MSFIAVFPGQGSQSVGMLDEFSAEFPIVQQTISEASDVLGYDVAKLIEKDPDHCLDQTVYTQPAMLIADVCLWRVWESLGGSQPMVMAGHSLGEYAAMTASGVMSFETALTIVQQRAAWMAEAVPEGVGAMAAVVGLEDQIVGSVCADVSERSGRIVEPVNFNAPGQVVIAGHKDAVETAIDSAKVAGAKLARIIPVSVPAHSSLMRPVTDKLNGLLADINFVTGQVPVIQNVDAMVHSESSEISNNLARQPAEPVQWVASIEKAQEMGASMSVEIGPAKVLAGLSRRINRKLPQQHSATPDALRAAIEATSI